MQVEWSRMPPLSALRAFQAVAAVGGYSSAARVLNVTHAAVAQQVRALETHLGVALVQRAGRGLVLTAEGADLARALDDGFGTIQTAVQALREGDADRPVRITLAPGFATQWLMPRLKDFWTRHPDIALSLHPDARMLDLRHDRMDLGIRYGDGHWPGVEARFLAPARLAVAAAPALLAGREALTLPEMQAEDWVLARDWPEQEAYLQAIGLDPARLSRTELPGEDLLLAAARQGLGLIVESIALLEGDLREGRLTLLHDSGDRLPAYFVVAPPGPQRATVRAFVRWLLAAA
jgi:LysR family glycine cleavage system transcriptional activator